MHAAADPELDRLRGEVAAFDQAQQDAFRAGAPVADLLRARARLRRLADRALG